MRTSFSIFLYVLLFSCTPQKKKNINIEFFKSKSRDSRLVGKFLLDTSDSSIVSVYDFLGDAQLHLYQTPNDTRKLDVENYWYSSNDTLYELHIGNRPDEISISKSYFQFNNSLDTFITQFVNVHNEIIIKTFSKM